MLARFTLASLLCTLVLICGCFETPFSLGSEADAKVDTAMCGDWLVESKDSPDKPKARMYIRNLDGKHYLVEWINPPEENQKAEDVEPLRMSAWTAAVNNVLFAHARDLPASGAIAEKHLVIRISFANDQIVLRNLSEEFFKTNSPASDADFRKLIEENLDNPDLYDHDEMLATRMAK